MAEASFEVDDYVRFVRVQSESAISRPRAHTTRHSSGQLDEPGAVHDCRNRLGTSLGLCTDSELASARRTAIRVESRGGLAQRPSGLDGNAR